MKFTCEKRKYLNQLTLYFFQVSNVTVIVGFSLNPDNWSIDRLGFTQYRQYFSHFKDGTFDSFSGVMPSI